MSSPASNAFGGQVSLPALSSSARDVGSDLEQRLAGRYVQGLQVRASKCAVGHCIFGNGDEFLELTVGRENVDAALRIQRLTGASKPVQTGGHIEVAVAVDGHPIAAATGIEVVEHTHVADRSVLAQIVPTRWLSPLQPTHLSLRSAGCQATRARELVAGHRMPSGPNPQSTR